MAKEYDGGIDLALNVSPEKAIKSAKRLQKSMQDIFDKVNGQKLDTQMEKYEVQMSKAVSTSDKLVKNLEKAQNKKVPTEEYTLLTNEIKKVEKEQDNLLKQKDRLSKKGKVNTEEYTELKNKISEVGKTLYELDEARQRHIDEGTAFTQDEEAIRAATTALQDYNNQMTLLETAAGEHSSTVVQSTEALAQQAQRIKEIQENAGAMNEEVFKAQLTIKNVTAELEQLNQRQQQLEQVGRGLGFEEYDQNLAKIRELEEELEKATNTLSEYREEASQGGEQTISVWDRVKNLFTQLGTDIAHPIQAIRRLRTETDGSGESADRSSSRFSRFSNVISGIGSVAGRIGSALRSLVSHFTRAGRSASNFGNKLNFKNILGYAIGIRSLFSLFSELGSAISSAVSDMAQLNGGMNQTNSAMSALQSSLNYLKGSLAAAFTPILTVVSPILSNFIDQIASVINAIGMMIAKLTGAKSYFKATKTSTNFAGSSGGSSGKSAQEKYEEALAKYQEKYDKQLAATREKNAKAAAKAEEQQAKAAARLAKQQEKANKQLASFDDLNVLNIEDLEELEEAEAEVFEDPEWDPPTLEDYMDASGGGGSGDPFGLEEVPLDDFEWDWDGLKAKAEELGRGLADMLNNIFADEDLAKKIGHNIAEALNTALHFAYGFIDQLDWRQMGRWFGTLITEGIETFEWDLLGKTIGELINGIADSIIGFFERYPVGLLGDSIATMFNNAIETVNPSLIGEAVADILKAPLIELRQFLTSANIELAGEKFRTYFIEVLQNKVLGNETLGQTIGTTLGTLINKAVAFFLAMDVSKLVAALSKFFNDIFFSAIDTIDWPSIGDLLYALTIGVCVGVMQGVADFVDRAVRKINPNWADALDVEGFNYWLDENFGSWDRYVDALQNGVKTLDGMMSPVEAGLNSLNGKLDEFTNGTAVNWGQSLRDVQREYQLTDEDMQTVIDLFVAQNDKVQDSEEILNGYTGDWIDYKGTIKDVPEFIKPTIEQQKLLDNAIEKTGDTAQDTKDDIVDYVKVSKEQMESGAQNAKDYENKVTGSMQGITDKSEEIVISFDTLTEQLGAELEGLTALIDEWYQNMILEYFGYDKWYTLLTENMLLAFNTFLTVDFLTMWDINMEVWWQNHVLIWFKTDKWQSEIFTPFFTFIKEKWKNLIDWWDKSVKEWYDKLKKNWTKFMEKVDEAIKKFLDKLKEMNAEIISTTDETWTNVQNTITEKINAAKEAVKSACEEMIAAINEVLAAMEALEAMGDGGGGSSSNSSSSNSNGGGSGRSGGGRYTPFMPMANIMHFEDNLGMSAFKFPELAQGAVIPPNNRFMAVLGDQRSGTNIETPLNTMLEAFRTVMDEYNSSRNQNAMMELDGEVFARLMLPYVMNEMQRQGYNTEIIEGTI